MYCNRCGKKLNAEDRFCSFCGSPVDKKETSEISVSSFGITEKTDAEHRQEKSVQQDRFEEEWEREERREKFTFMIFGILIVVLIVAITSGVAVLLQRESEKSLMNDMQISAELKNELEQSQKRDEVLAELEKDNADNTGKDNQEANNFSGSNNTEVVITPELIVPNEISKDDEPENKDEQKNAENNNRDTREYIIYDSDVRYLVSADLNNLTAWEIRVARNEIFARHGRMFDSLELKEYFESKSWYEPTIPAVEFNNSCLSAIELENLNFIINYEKAHNLN